MIINIKKWFFNKRQSKEKKVNLLKNDNLNILKNDEITKKELIKYNAEKERLQLIETFRLPLKSTWKDIVNKNDKLIEKQTIKIK